MELFLPKNDFQISFTKHVSKIIQILEAWKPTEDIEFTLNFFWTFPST